MTQSQEGDPHRSLLSRVRIVHALPLVPVFLVSLFAAGAIGDNSFLWHVRAGEAQFSSGAVLSRDVFSFTELGASWRTQSWLADLLYHGFESVSTSLVWANWMALVVTLVTVVMVGLAVYRSTPSPLTTGGVLVLVVWLLGPFVLQRPVIFSFALLAALVVVLQNRGQVLWLVVPIIWIWAAFHGSWVIGGLLLLLEWLRTKDRRLFWVGVLALLATLATAHGFGTWIIVFDFLGAREALSLMSEWKVPNFGSAVQMPYLLLIAAVLIAAVKSKLTMRDLIVVIPIIAFGMTARRTVVPAMIILVPWAALALPPVRVPRSGGGRVLAGAVVGLIAVVAVLPMLAATGELAQDRFPSDDVLDRLADRNPFYDDGVGGFLIYKEWPDDLVWIDDRAELHGVERLTELRQALDGHYEGVFERYGFDAALTKPDWDLTSQLLADGWIIDYENDDFMVLFP